MQSNLFRVAVITPYYKESRAYLQRCINSVRDQDYSCEITQILVADGHAQDWIDSVCAESQPLRSVRHLRLDITHADYGNTPRALAGLMAVSEGFHAICFLDADNWLEPDHISECLHVAQQSPEPIDWIHASRLLCREDGTRLDSKVEEIFNSTYADTNCQFLFPGAFHMLTRWILLPKPLAAIADDIIHRCMVEAGLRSVRTRKPTVNYLCTWIYAFECMGETPPPYAKPNVDRNAIADWIAGLNPRQHLLIERYLNVQLSLY